jgi:GT2 family glycosyltransferase
MWMLQNAPDATHIFFLDNDVILEGGMDILDAIDQMVKLDLDIVSGCIRTKKPPDLEIMLYKQDKEKHFHALKSIDFTKKTIEVDGVGAGFLLIKKDMFYKIQRPWFQVHTLEETMTEDIEFCLRAKKAGYKIYAYTGVHLSHIGYFAVRLDQLIGDVWSEAQ